MSKRFKYIDFLRQIALFHMIFQHSVLALLENFQNTNLTYFFYEIIPICPALFLFLSGFSINIKRIQPIEGKKYRKRIVKGLLLIFSANLLFFIEHGLQFPDLLFSPGILNTIGLLIITCTILQRLPYRKILTLALISILLALFILLDYWKIKLFPLNQGYEPLLPTLIYGYLGFAGSLFMQTMSVRQKKWFMISLILLGALILGYFFYQHGFFKILYSQIGRYTIARTFDVRYLPYNIWNFTYLNASFYQAYVWNYTFSSFLACAGIVWLLLGVSYFLEHIFQHQLPEWLFLPGQFALVNYFFHLSVIAVFVLFFGYQSIGSKEVFYFFLILLFISTYVTAYIALKIQKKRLLSPG